MTEDIIETIKVPEVKRIKELSRLEQSFHSLLESITPKTNLDRLNSEQMKVKVEKDSVLYKDILSPDYDERPITEPGERNRQILLWALDRNISVPAEFISRNAYENVPITELLNKVFSSEEIYDLHSAMVYLVAKNIKGVEDGSTKVFGGVIYSQELIDPGEPGIEGKISGIISRLTAVPSGFSEPGITPPLLRKNVKGSVHVLPYGVAEKVSGKERETLLMIIDDFIRLLDYLATSDQMSYPRFILNGTNKNMGKIAEKLVDAQVRELEGMEQMAGSFMGSLSGTLTNSDAVKVFIPERAIRKGKKRLIPLRDKLYGMIGKIKGVSMPDYMKEVRIDAINNIVNNLNFVSCYNFQKEQINRRE